MYVADDRVGLLYVHMSKVRIKRLVVTCNKKKILTNFISCTCDIVTLVQENTNSIDFYFEKTEEKWLQSSSTRGNKHRTALFLLKIVNAKFRFTFLLLTSSLPVNSRGAPA